MFTQKNQKNVLQIFCQTESIFFDKTNRKVKENCFKQIQSDKYRHVSRLSLDTVRRNRTELKPNMVLC